MIAQDIAHSISQSIAAGIQVEAIETDRLVVYMPFLYDDGDQCGIYLSRMGEKTWALSDDGESLRRASYSGVNLESPIYAEQLKSLVDYYGATQDHGQLLFETDEDSLAQSLFTFTQTCLEASWLPKMSVARKASTSSTFSRRLEKLVTAAVSQPVDKDWHHPEYDPKSIYPVDFHVQGRKRQLYLFGVPNKYACQRATIACQHYKLSGVDFEAIAIYDHEEELPRVAAEQLNEIVDRRFPRISESRTIKEYISALAV